MIRSDAQPASIRLVPAALLLVAAVLSPFGCDEDSPTDDPDVYGELIGSQGCKQLGKSAFPAASSDEECLEWDLQADILAIRHVNAAFNCCVDDLSADVVVAGSSITVVETETLENGLGCDCLCLYDLDYLVHNPPPGVYSISVTGPYSPEPLDTTIDLVGQPTGVYCEDRDEYPWGF